MRIFLKYNSLVLMLIASLLLMGADNAEQGADDRVKLLEQQRQLKSRIEKLEREQDYLLFQKSMYELDSKYVVIRPASKSGQLKYKNRVLMDFHVLSMSHAGRLKRGALTVTQKIEGPKGRNALILGRSVVLLGSHAPALPPDAGAARISLARKDFRAVFYALEEGAKVYILF